MIFESLINDFIELLGGEHLQFFLEKDSGLTISFQTELIVQITHEELSGLDLMEINAELGEIPDNPQCLIALLMANKHQLEDEKALFSINASSGKVNCTIKLNVEDIQASTILEQIKRLVSYQEWFTSFQDEANNNHIGNLYNIHN